MSFGTRTEVPTAMQRAVTDPTPDISVAIICMAPLRNTAVLGGTYASVLGEGLQSHGTRVALWTRIGPENLAEVSVPVLQVWRPGILAWFDILKAVIKARPQVVHLQHFFFLLGNGSAGEVSTILLMVGLAILGTHVVVTIHDVPGREQITREYVRLHKYKYPTFVVRIGIKMLMRLLGTCARHVIVHNHIFAERLAEFHVNPQKIAVIPFPNEPVQIENLSRSSAREALGLDASARIVLFFGYATGYKGIEQLLGAFEILEKQGSHVRLLFGSGVRPKMGNAAEYAEYYGALKSRASAISLVDFVGFIDPADLGTYIAAADIGVLPYVEYHGASGPLHHYLWHGRPVLVSRRISEHTPGLEIASFEARSAEIARVITRFFEDETFRVDVIRECASLRSGTSSDDSSTLTRSVYTRALTFPRLGAA